jgi:hypothetical protein
MKYIVTILIISLSILISGQSQSSQNTLEHAGSHTQASIALSPSNLPRTRANQSILDLSVDALDSVLGIQFDLQYNPDELKFYGASCLLDEFMFEYRNKDDGIVRGLLYSMSGAVINSNHIAHIISFDFKLLDGFNGESRIEFTDLILAGANGSNIPATAEMFFISPGILVPTETKLHSSYPNPFNSVTIIKYDLAVDGFTKVSVFDILGRLIASIVNGYQPAGSYEVAWDAANLSTGVYFLKIATVDYTASQKLVLMK